MRDSISSLRAIGFALAGYLLWTIGDVFMKFGSLSGLPKYEIMSFAGIGGVTTILLISFSHHANRIRFRPKHPFLLTAVGIMYTANYIFMAWTLLQIPLANFYTIAFMSPLVIVAFAALLLREPLRQAQAVAILFGFAGVVIATNPSNILNGSGKGLAYAAAFSCVFFNAVQILLLRILGPRENRETIIFFQRVTGIVCGAVLCLALGAEPPTADAFFYSLLSGVVGSIGWLCMAYAYKLAPAATIAPFHYSQLISGALFGYLLWSDIPSLHVIIGAVIIATSGIYVATHARRMEKVSRMMAENPRTSG